MARKKFTEHDMYDNVRTSLRAKFKASEGWTIHGPMDKRKEGYHPDFVLERKVKEGWIFIDRYTEKIIVEVKAESSVNQNHVDQLNGYAKKHAGKDVRIRGKILAIPAGANIASVKNIISREQIDLMWMKSFQRGSKA